MMDRNKIKQMIFNSLVFIMFFSQADKIDLIATYYYSRWLEDRECLNKVLKKELFKYICIDLF